MNDDDRLVDAARRQSRARGSACRSGADARARPARAPAMAWPVDRQTRKPRAVSGPPAPSSCRHDCPTRRARAGPPRARAPRRPARRGERSFPASTRSPSAGKRASIRPRWQGEKKKPAASPAKATVNQADHRARREFARLTDPVPRLAHSAYRRRLPGGGLRRDFERPAISAKSASRKPGLQDHPQARQGAEMARFEDQNLRDIRHRTLIIAEHIAHGRPLVPRFGPIGAQIDDRIEQRQRQRIIFLPRSPSARASSGGRLYRNRSEAAACRAPRRFPPLRRRRWSSRAGRRVRPPAQSPSSLEAAAQRARRRAPAPCRRSRGRRSGRADATCPKA